MKRKYLLLLKLSFILIIKFNHQLSHNILRLNSVGIEVTSGDPLIFHN